MPRVCSPTNNGSNKPLLTHLWVETCIEGQVLGVVQHEVLSLLTHLWRQRCRQGEEGG
jgi:hypothetical protein